MHLIHASSPCCISTPKELEPENQYGYSTKLTTTGELQRKPWLLQFEAR